MSLFVKDERLTSPIQPATRLDRLRADGWEECSHCEGTGGIDHGGGITPWDGPADIEPCGCADGLVPPEGMVWAAAHAGFHRTPLYNDSRQQKARAALIAAARWEVGDE